MKKLAYILLALMPLFASAGLPRTVVEQKYISQLAKSFTDPALSAPRSPLFWSLCLGETTELSRNELNKRITALGTDNAALIAFYKRLNFYRDFKSHAGAAPNYADLYLPEYKKEKPSDKDMRLVHQLSRDKPEITWDDWLAYVAYVNDLGDDANLTSQWESTASVGPDGPQKQILTTAEDEPQFPGGDAALMNLLVNQIQYPQMERDNGIQGKVLLRFVVCPDGHVSQGEIMRSVSPGLDREAMLIVKMLPRFTPGKQQGSAVPVYYNLPVAFRLQ
jgi:TonB family protein